MKKFIVLFFSLLAITVCFSQTGATKKLTAQDSALLEQQAANKFVDSVVTKTSIKEFREFLYSTITAKQLDEGKFIELYDFFIRSKYQQWIQEKQAKKPPN